MILKTSFKDWYDYLLDLEIADSIYPRYPRIYKKQNSVNNDQYKLNLDWSAKNFIENAMRGRCDFAIWIGVYPYLYLCPTRPWVYDKIEFNWWNYYQLSPEEWENKFIEFLKKEEHQEYINYLKILKGRKSKPTESRFIRYKTWAEEMASRGEEGKNLYTIIRELKKFSQGLEWDPKVKTFKIYNSEIFREINAPILAAYFNFDYILANPNLSEFNIPVRIPSDLGTPGYCGAKTIWSENSYEIPSDLKEGLIDISDRISEFITAAKEPVDYKRSDKEKIISYGFDPKTSFRNIK